VRRPESSRPHGLAERLETLVTDPVDLAQLLERLEAPLASRYSMIRSDRVGPMPSSVSSCSGVAELRLIGAAGAAPATDEPVVPLVPDAAAGAAPASGTSTCWPS